MSDHLTSKELAWLAEWVSESRATDRSRYDLVDRAVSQLRTTPQEPGLSLAPLSETDLEAIDWARIAVLDDRDRPRDQYEERAVKIWRDEERWDKALSVLDRLLVQPASSRTITGTGDATRDLRASLEFVLGRAESAMRDARRAHKHIRDGNYEAALYATDTAASQVEGIRTTPLLARTLLDPTPTPGSVPMEEP